MAFLKQEYSSAGHRSIYLIIVVNDRTSKWINHLDSTISYT